MKINNEQKIAFFQELTNLFATGFNLAEVIDYLQSSFGKEIQFSLKRGEPLSKILAKYKFEPEIICLMHSAEATGELKNVLEAISRYYETRKSIKDRLFQLLLYPLITLGFALLIILFFFIAILPRFAVIYESMGMQVQHNNMGIFFLLSLIILVGLIFYYRKNIKQIIFQTKIIKNYQLIYLLYIFGLLLPNVDLAGFLWQLAAYHPYARELYNLAFYLKKGCLLSNALKEVKLIDQSIYNILLRAEKANTLKTTITQLAKDCEQKFIKKLERLLMFAEPAVIVLVGLFIGCLSMQILLPITRLTQNLM